MTMGPTPLRPSPTVKIPSGYNYLPCHMPEQISAANRLSNSYYLNGDKLSLHDFCTFSPDYWISWSLSRPMADLRGPCAIHDLCYEKMVKTNARNYGGRMACDIKLGRNVHFATLHLGMKESFTAASAYRDVAIFAQKNYPTNNWP